MTVAGRWGEATGRRFAAGLASQRDTIARVAYEYQLVVIRERIQRAQRQTWWERVERWCRR